MSELEYAVLLHSHQKATLLTADDTPRGDPGWGLLMELPGNE